MSALCSVESSERAFIGENGWAFIRPAQRWLRLDRHAAFEQVFQGNPECITPERQQNVSFAARLLPMKQRSNRKLALQRSKRRFGLGQLHVLRPQFFGRRRRHSRHRAPQRGREILFTDKSNFPKTAKSPQPASIPRSQQNPISSKITNSPGIPRLQKIGGTAAAGFGSPLRHNRTGSSPDGHISPIHVAHTSRPFHNQVPPSICKQALSQEKRKSNKKLKNAFIPYLPSRPSISCTELLAPFRAATVGRLGPGSALRCFQASGPAGGVYFRVVVFINDAKLGGSGHKLYLLGCRLIKQR
jgi:hypothetical protein